MIARYTRPGMGAIWTDENKYRMWLKVESAASETLAEDGIVPREAAAAIRDKGDFDLKRILEIEAEVKHDVIAFTTAVAEKIGPQARWLHYGLTSNDVVDTAQALQVKAASGLLRHGILGLKEVLKRRALEFQHTPTIGRTHGVHAEPTTFGLKLLNWYAEMRAQPGPLRCSGGRHARRQALRRGGHLRPSQAGARRAHLRAAGAEARAGGHAGDPARPARALHFDAGRAGSDARQDRVEIRHLQRTEVREAEEYFSEKQKGSSARCRTSAIPSPASRSAGWRAWCAPMRRRRLRMWRCGTSAISRTRRWSASSFPIRPSWPTTCWRRRPTLIDQLLVYPERMKRNLESTGGLIFSGQLLLDLAEAGMSREDAYRLVQSHAMRAWKEDLVFRDEVAQDPEITARLSPEKLARTFDLQRQLRNVDAIFDRVLKYEAVPA